MCQSQDADIPHRLAEIRFDDAVAHADNEKEEEGKRISASIEDGDDYHQKLRQRIIPVIVGVV